MEASYSVWFPYRPLDVSLIVDVAKADDGVVRRVRTACDYMQKHYHTTHTSHTIHSTERSTFTGGCANNPHKRHFKRGALDTFVILKCVRRQRHVSLQQCIKAAQGNQSARHMIVLTDCLNAVDDQTPPSLKGVLRITFILVGGPTRPVVDQCVTLGNEVPHSEFLVVTVDGPSGPHNVTRIYDFISESKVPDSTTQYAACDQFNDTLDWSKDPRVAPPTRLPPTRILC